MNAEQVLCEINTLPVEQRRRVVERALLGMSADERAPVERLLARVQRRIAHPEIPDDFWVGLEQAEDGDLIDMETALSRPFPGGQQA